MGMCLARAASIRSPLWKILDKPLIEMMEKLGHSVLITEATVPYCPFDLHWVVIEVSFAVSTASF